MHEVPVPKIVNALAYAALALSLAFGAMRSAGAADAAAFELISPAEAQLEVQAAGPEPGPLRPRQRSLRLVAPQIQVLAPSVDAGAVVPPLRIELAFKPAPGTRVVPSSFRAYYGVLKIDLTERLSKYATISESGVVVDRAQVPEGVHRFVLSVRDDQGNLGEQELRVRVSAKS